MSHWVSTKGRLLWMGRSPAEIAEGAKDYWEGECSYIGAFFCNSPGLLKRYI